MYKDYLAEEGGPRLDDALTKADRDFFSAIAARWETLKVVANGLGDLANAFPGGFDSIATEMGLAGVAAQFRHDRLPQLPFDELENWVAKEIFDVIDVHEIETDLDLIQRGIGIWGVKADSEIKKLRISGRVSVTFGERKLGKLEIDQSRLNAEILLFHNPLMGLLALSHNWIS